MKLQEIIFGLILTLVMASCSLISIKGNPIKGMYSGYERTMAAYPALLVQTNSALPVCDLKYPGQPKVYVVNGAQLKTCVSGFEDAIVYIWDAHCKGKNCHSPSLLQRYCDEKGVELFVVAEYYDGVDLTQFYQIKRPLFGIDTKYYESDFIEKYRTRFEQDLIGQKTETGRMLYFKKGTYRGDATINFEN